MKRFDVVIIGGSYAGLAAAMALGRALKKVLVIDSGLPANRQTPFAHNILTRDGTPPAELSAIARKQAAYYPTVSFVDGVAASGVKTSSGFAITLETGESFIGQKLVFASGIKDSLPPVPGLADCWGISVIHCPYCHGYEVRNAKTGVLANGDKGFEFTKLLSNWTGDLTLFTNGASTLSVRQSQQLAIHSIQVVETSLESIQHINGYLTHLQMRDGCMFPLAALYAQVPFTQHSFSSVNLGCALTTDGYIQADATGKTTVEGIYACGDNTSRVRTVANAIGIGTTCGMTVNREMVMDAF